MSRGRFDYAGRAKALRKFGYVPKYGSKKKGSTSPAAKAAVRKLWNKIHVYAVPGEAARKGKYKFKFVRADTPAKVEAMAGLNPKVRTPTGFFVRVPTNAAHYRVGFKGGVLKVTAEGRRGGKRTEWTYRLNAKKLAEDPPREIRRVTDKRPKIKTAKLVVNGFDAHTFQRLESDFDLDEFETYIADFYNQSQEPEKQRKAHIYPARFHGAKVSPKEFTDIFHLKLITQTPSRKKSRVKKRKTNRRR